MSLVTTLPTFSHTNLCLIPRNYGIPGDDLDQYGLPKFFESIKIWVKALIVAEISENFSHWTAKKYVMIIKLNQEKNYSSMRA
jgi:hypothetical protein